MRRHGIRQLIPQRSKKVMWDCYKRLCALKFDNLEEMDKFVNCKTFKTESRWNRQLEKTDNFCLNWILYSSFQKVPGIVQEQIISLGNSRKHTFEEFKCKTSQQRMILLNSTMYRKDSTPSYIVFYLRVTVQHLSGSI